MCERRMVVVKGKLGMCERRMVVERVRVMAASGSNCSSPQVQPIQSQRL
jgi:hypothetical protein